MSILTTTSLKLLEDLEDKIYACGTGRDRMGFPPQLKKPNLKNVCVCVRVCVHVVCAYIIIHTSVTVLCMCMCMCTSTYMQHAYM